MAHERLSLWPVPAAYRPRAVIQPRRELALQEQNRRRQRVTGPHERCGKPFRECCRRSKERLAALELSKGRDVEYAAGLALALCGGSSRSAALAAI